MSQMQPSSTSRFSGGVLIAIASGALLLLFIGQNREDVKFHFLGITFTWPLWLYTIVVAACGALVWIGIGVMRRHRRREARREAR
jgi:uncharacterized integral membrane protein